MKELYENLPKLPGVYLFKNKQEEIIYIGKAKSLKERVTSYFYNKDDWKVVALVAEIVKVEHIITHTEHEALLLEADLIKTYYPKFNVLLKSGQPFVYLVITKDPVPQLKITRSRTRKKGSFGPFIQKQQARSVHTFLTNTFGLVLCNKKIENGCLDFHLGRCAGTCMKTFNTKDYLFRLSLAETVLKKDHEQYLQHLNEKIKGYSAKKEFEKARNMLTYKENAEIIFSTLESKYSPEKYLFEITKAEMNTFAIENYQETAQQIRIFLQLKKQPISIDCFDISHFQSRYIVGSCVRFTNGIPDKNKFRRFKITSLVVQNDYAALQEIVTRRYKKPEDIPDLVVIDGGKGQRNAVLEVLKKVPCVSLAKKEEILFSNAHPQGTKLLVKDPVGKLFISLRDYAHHFAISYHRLLRSQK